MTRYQGDPRKITAGFGKCSSCGREVKGETVLYFPRSRSVQCNVTEKCRQDNEKVLCAIFDEDFLSAQ